MEECQEGVRILRKVYSTGTMLVPFKPGSLVVVEFKKVNGKCCILVCPEG